SIAKILVPEKDLVESDRPFESAVRLIRRGTDGAETSIDCQTSKLGCRLLEHLFFWTPGMLKGATAGDGPAKDIEYQNGRLKNAHSFTGKRTLRRNKIDGEATESYRYAIWLHPDAALGFAEARIESEVVRGENRRSYLSIYRIQDFGSGAKSEISDE